MLGWVLRRGLEPTKGAKEDGDDTNTTQIDAPDTPAPVFAARALKTAIFGDGDATKRRAVDRGGRLELAHSGGRTPPSKPPGILLTPGTGTSRPKRVSFGNDVLADGSKAASMKAGTRAGRDSTRRRTRLTELMANSRQNKAKASTAEKRQPMPEVEEKDDDDDEWEEEDDDEDAADDDDDDCCSHDITVDLNEPHSRSGKYWKSNFESYHKDAKAEMEKLLKYKQLAKSYAKMKDTEAIDLNEKLKEEQEKVLEMEKKLSEMAAQIATRRLKGGDHESPDLLRNLAKQTALAVQYRSQVKELESLLRNRQEDGRHRRTAAASPRTHRTLLETQRELRRARSELREMGDLQDEVARLKAQLETAEQRSAKLEEENTRLARGGNGDDGSSYVKDLMAQLRDAKAETRNKDVEIRRLQKEFDEFKQEAIAQQEDTKAVLEKATEKISELKRELRILKASKDERGTRPKSFHGLTSTETRKPSTDEKPDIHVDLRDLARLTNSASPPAERPTRPSSTLANELDAKRVRVTQASRALRERFLGEPDDFKLGLKTDDAPRNLLTDRVNLERPKWQPYVPRSPRNRAYLRDAGRRNGGLDLDMADAEPKDDHAITEMKLAATVGQVGLEQDDDDQPQLDMLRERFKHLGLPDTNGSSILAGNTSRCTLPPDRRAAALARIEQRKAERRQAIAGTLKALDKENMRPTAATTRDHSSW